MNHLRLTLHAFYTSALFTSGVALADQGGLEVAVRGAYGSAGDTSPIGAKSSATVSTTSNTTGAGVGYSTGPMASAQLGFRFDKFVSAGLYGGVGASPAVTLGSSAKDGKRSSWGAGFYVRAYPLARAPGLSKSLDPWVSAGVGYLADTQAYTTSIPTTAGTSIDGTVKAEHHAIAVPLALGVDYRALPYLSVGPYVEYTLANAVGACTSVSASGYTGSSYCSNTSPGDQVLEAKNYSVLAGGISLKLTPF